MGNEKLKDSRKIDKSFEDALDKLQFMLDNLHENRPLYKDSGLWQVRSDDMEDVLYQQECNEDFYVFIKRVFNAENQLQGAY